MRVKSEPSHPVPAGYVETVARVNGQHIEIGGRRLVYGPDGLQKE
jgi:hypothetical protein